MNKYYFIYLTWLLPLYFLSMSIYQVLAYRGINETYESGMSYVADVVEFDVKQIAAQTSGYVVLTFEDENGERIERRLSLSVQMAQVIMDSERIPVRFQPDSFRNVVIVSTYELQRNIIRVNFAVLFIGFFTTMLIALYSTRFANKRIREGDEEMIFERVDNNDT